MSMDAGTRLTLIPVERDTAGGPALMSVVMQRICKENPAADVDLLWAHFASNSSSVRVWAIQTPEGDVTGHILANISPDIQGEAWCVWVNQLVLDRSVPDGMTDAFMRDVSRWAKQTAPQCYTVCMSSKRKQDHPETWLRRFGFKQDTIIYSRPLQASSE